MHLLSLNDEHNLFAVGCLIVSVAVPPSSASVFVSTSLPDVFHAIKPIRPFFKNGSLIHTLPNGLRLILYESLLVLISVVASLFILFGGILKFNLLLTFP